MALGVATVGQIVLYFPENGSAFKCNGATSIPGIVQQILPNSINLFVFSMCTCKCHESKSMMSIKYKEDAKIGGILTGNVPYWFETEL